MKRRLIILSVLLTLVLSLLTVVQNHEHVHAGVPCPLCGSTDTTEGLTNLPTCTAPGVQYYTCHNSSCPSGSFSIEIPATGHNYGGDDNIVVISPATCTTTGRGTKTCINSVTCGSSITVTIPALGHNYTSTVTKATTCTETGLKTNTCSRCGDSNTETIQALGHNYKKQIVKTATCEEDGQEKYACSRCNKSYTKDIPALGHDYVYEESEATCTNEGHKIGICKRCNDKTEEIFPALGHDMADPVIVQEATCTKDGIKEGICKRCEEKTSEIIPMLGHDFGDWVIQVEATYFKEGLQSKTCSRCDERLEETIAKLNPTPLITKAGIGVVGLGIVGGGIYFGLTKSGIIGKKIVKNVVEAAGEKFIPKFETKTIITTFKDYKLFELLKKQRYLSVKTCDFASLDSSIEENEPHLIIIDVLSDEHLNELVDIINDEENENKFAFLVHPDVLNDHKDELDGLKKNKKFIGYVSILDDPYLGLVKLILPILKPEIKSDETLENIGGIADALGVPGISKIIDVYISGRDIKATLDEGELGISEDASIISNIASILGFDTIASVTGLVEDINDIKTAVDKESGLSEEVDGVEAAKDVVEVISDLINKE